MQTLAVRLERLERSTLEVANWLAQRPEIARVLHPALPSCPGHELWRRDFTGSTSVFSVEFIPSHRRARVHAFVDALQLFEIGWSWGGVTSLAVPVNPPRTVAARREGVLVRLNIGLEAPSDLLADLEAGLSQL
jgi:cystathionine beta-lyase